MSGGEPFSGGAPCTPLGFRSTSLSDVSSASCVRASAFCWRPSATGRSPTAGSPESSTAAGPHGSPRESLTFRRQSRSGRLTWPYRCSHRGVRSGFRSNHGCVGGGVRCSHHCDFVPCWEKTGCEVHHDFAGKKFCSAGYFWGPLFWVVIPCTWTAYNTRKN